MFQYYYYRVQPINFTKLLRNFLEDNHIRTENVERLIHYITEELGAYEFEDLKGLTSEQLKEELTGNMLFTSIYELLAISN